MWQRGCVDIGIEWKRKGENMDDANGDDDEQRRNLAQVMSPSAVPVPNDESRFLDDYVDESHHSLFNEDSEEDLGFEPEGATRPTPGSRRVAPGDWDAEGFSFDAPSGAAASSGAAGQVTSPSPFRVQIGTPSPDDERSL